MILEPNNIFTWDQLKDTFIKKYNDYYKARKIKDEIFIMVQGPKESLKDYEEWFQLS